MFSRRSLAFLPRILQGTRLLTGNVAASAIPTDVECARYLGKRRYSRESPGATRRTVPIPRVLSRFAFFQSPASLRAKERPSAIGGALQRGTAETSKRAAASHAWLARVRISLSLSHSLLRPSFLSLLFSVPRPDCSIPLFFILAYLQAGRDLIRVHV